MVVRDLIISWYLRNIYLPKREIIEKPGFIGERLGERKNYLREITFPEMLGSKLEEQINSNILYSIGKKFGWVYAVNSVFVTIDKISKKEFIEKAHLLVKYMEAISLAQKMKESLQYDRKIFQLQMKNTWICSKNGLGYLFSTGGIAGVWAYAVQDPTVEAVQPKCQGRGDPKCEVIAAPYEILVKMGYKPIRCTKLETFEMDKTYEQFNQIRPTKWAKHSLRSLIDSKFFEFKHGQVTYKGERFFLCEASFMYILEKELKKLKNGLKTLWQVSFDFGKRLAEISGKQNPCKFIIDFFPALGFGDILATFKKGKYKIYVNYFPWTKWANEIDFIMFRGLLSGVISGFIGKKVELKKYKIDLSAGYLSLIISE